MDRGNLADVDWHVHLGPPQHTGYLNRIPRRVDCPSALSFAATSRHLSAPSAQAVAALFSTNGVTLPREIASRPVEAVRFVQRTTNRKEFFDEPS